MDPDARIQQATLGTALYYSTSDMSFIGSNGSYTKADLEAKLNGTQQTPTTYTRVHGLASTPDFGGQPNTIDTTTLDNKKSETSVLGLQPATEVTYEINMMTFADVPSGETHNLRGVKALADTPTPAHWVLVKASGVIIEYNADTYISYTADAQQDIEKFNIYHNLRSDIAVSLPST